MNFWHDIITHQEVEPFVLRGLASVDEFYDWLESPGVTEIRYDGGGFVFVEKEGYEEIHVAFLPEYWGRPLALAFRDCFMRKMQQAETIVAHEWEDNWRSRPPRSYGFVPDGVFIDSNIGARCKRWVLTRDAWMRSPVFRKIECHS